MASTVALDPVKQPLVNVTLPVYNEARVLAGSVEKLRVFLARQRGLRFEVVIEINGSTDQTRAGAEELSRNSQSVRVVKTEVAVARGGLRTDLTPERSRALPEI
jgi:hypothetical protein